jgi:hypothetical protein
MLMNKPLPNAKEKEAIIERLMAYLNTTGEK